WLTSATFSSPRKARMKPRASALVGKWCTSALTASARVLKLSKSGDIDFLTLTLTAVRFRQQRDVMPDPLPGTETVRAVQELHHACRAACGDRTGSRTGGIHGLPPRDVRRCPEVGQPIRSATSTAGVRLGHLLKDDTRDGAQNLARLAGHFHGFLQMARIVVGHHRIYPARWNAVPDDIGQERGDVIGVSAPVRGSPGIRRIVAQQLRELMLPGAAAGTAAGDNVPGTALVHGLDIVPRQSPGRDDIPMNQNRSPATLLVLG